MKRKQTLNHRQEILNTQAPIVAEQLPLPIVLILAVTLGEQACKINSSTKKPPNSFHQLFIILFPGK